MFGTGYFYTRTFKTEFARYSGRSGTHFEFIGKRKKHLESYPVFATIFHLDYHQIQNEAVDIKYYRSGDVMVGYAELELHNRPNPFLNYYFRTGLKMGILHSQFLRLNFQTNIYYRLTKKIRTKLRIWVGGFIYQVDLPQQYQTYLSGGIDPDFRNEYVINRSADLNDISIGTRQYEISGPSLNGLVIDESGKMMGFNRWVFSVNYDMSLPKLPGRPFIDIAIVQGSAPYIDIGLRKSFGPIEFIIPVYQSWDEISFIQDGDWLLDRLRIKLNIPSFNFGDLF